ncbi:DNA helicase MCM8 isoform X1 [Zootermopsis nevadensis]|uniref:DNA helicase MCM8 isoform X1 n=2 Tax=Zootermopsis nevadensis TaxID=136037 RepID=UPI000B8E4085|nr:DNA helicase MCM8 isoform X1 [Zootermopsis nevadensis]
MKCTRTKMNRGISNSEGRGTGQARGRGDWQSQGRGFRHPRGRDGSQSQGRGKGFRGRWNWFNKKSHEQTSNRHTNMHTLSNRSIIPSSLSQNSQPQIIDFFQNIPSPYEGWKLYFPQEAYKEGSTTVNKVQAMEKFINRNSSVYSYSVVEERRSFSIDLKNLKSDNDFTSEWATFEEDLSECPEQTINCLGLAMHQVVLSALQSEVKSQLQDEEVVPPIVLPSVRARIMNFEPITQLKNLKAVYFGKLVSVRGTIIRVGNIKLLCVWMAFQCNTCLALQCVKQPEGCFTQPTKCITEGCRAKSFTPLHTSPFTQTINWQSVRLQEIVSDDQREGGRVPRTVECELTEDLLDSCIPGDVVTITGIVKVRNGEEYNKKKVTNMFDMYIEAVSVVNSKNESHTGCTKGTGIEFNIKDYYAIQEIHSQPDLFRFLVNSLCPTIYGHETVKAGLLLALFGGTLHHTDGRSDPHVLVVGDPGLGKSQMLQACASIAPRGVYVCGNTSTITGLTVTLTREAGGNYTLEAGALVLADQGCCCIDEFDKMTNQHQALLEAMEQQSISIAKAGVVCSLPARTSILAAANPTGGHYNRAKTVSENLRMGPALLSRFDLVFILLDQPNEQLDSLLSEHVMALHSGFRRRGEARQQSGTASDCGGEETERPLYEWLKLRPGETMDFLPHQLFRKYLMYARKYVRSRLTPPAASVLQKFYLDLRRQHQSNDCTPITTRQLESLIRLTEARAKLELREEATEKDAQDIVEIMKYSLVDTLSDGFGCVDFQRSQNGSGMSSRNQGKRFITALQQRANAQSRSVFSVQELKEVAELARIKVSDFYGFLSTLNVQGFLLKKAPKLYQLLTVDY